VGSGEVCPKCQDLLTEDLAARDALSQLSVDSCRLSSKLSVDSSQLSENPTDNRQPFERSENTQPTTASLRARLAEAGRRREYVWLAGHADLLQRCTTFGPMARAQPR